MDTLKVLLSICFLHIQLICWGQQYDVHDRIDSLKSRLEIEHDSVQYGLICTEIGYEYFDNDNGAALEYLTEAFKILSNHSSDSLQLVRAGRLKGQILRRLGRLIEAEKVFLQVLSTAHSQHLYNEETKILNGLGVLYTFSTQYDKALDVNFKSLLLKKKFNDPYQIATTEINIALVYYKLKRYQTAIEYSLIAIKRFNTIDQKDQLIANELSVAYSNMALSYLFLEKPNDYQKAYEYLKLSEKYCNNECSPTYIISTQFGYGVYYMKIKQYQKSIQVFKDAIVYANQKKDYHALADLYTYYGLALYLKHDLSSSVEAYQNAEAISKKHNFNQCLLDIYKQMAAIYHNRDITIEADYQSKYIHLRDSLFSESFLRNIADLETAFLNESNVETIHQIDQQKTLQRRVIVYSIMILILLILFIVLIFLNRKKNKRINESLNAANEIIQAQSVALARQNELLKQEVDYHTNDLAVTLHSLHQINVDLKEFILRTNNDIVPLVNQLKETLKSTLHNTQLVNLSSVSDMLSGNIFRLERMIIIQSHVKQLAPVNIFATLNDAALNTPVKYLDVQVAGDKDIMIHTDGRLLSQLIIGLLENIDILAETNDCKTSIQFGYILSKSDLIISAVSVPGDVLDEFDISDSSDIVSGTTKYMLSKLSQVLNVTLRVVYGLDNKSQIEITIPFSK